MADTPKLSIPEIAAAQSSKYVTHNVALQMLDAFVFCSAKDRTNTPPGAPSEGDVYIVTAVATGVWTGHENDLTQYYNAAWAFYTPNEGWSCWIKDEDCFRAFDGADWIHTSDFFVNYMGSPMIVTGGVLSAGSNPGTFKVTALTALLRNTNGGSTVGPLAYVTLAEQDNQAITLANTSYRVILEYNGGSPQISINTVLPNRTTNINIGWIRKDAIDTIHFLNSGLRLQDGLRKLHERARELRAIELASGSVIGYQGVPAANQFTMTAGVVLVGINWFDMAVFDSNVDKFTYIYQDGLGDWTYVDNSTVIDTGHYDDGSGGLAVTGNNKYSCHWVYKHVDDEHVCVLYGRGSYSLAEAETATEPTRPDCITDFGCLIGKIITPKAGGSFTEVQMVSDTFFVGTRVSDHNELGSLQGGIINEYYHLRNEEVLDPTPADDHTGNGKIITDTVDENTVGFSGALHIDADGNWIDASQAAAVDLPCRALALEAGTGAGKKLLLKGFIRDDTWTWTLGGDIYAGVDGALTQVVPGSGTFLQILGHAKSATVVYFDPDDTIVGVK